MHDNEAVLVRGVAIGGNRYRIGYLSAEHARMARRLLEASGNRYGLVELPDLTRTHETRIKLRFVVPSQIAQELEDGIWDVCGKVRRERHVFVGYD